jgi:cytochrome c553
LKPSLADGWWRPLAFGLVVAAIWHAAAAAQDSPLSERIKVCEACHGKGGNSRTANIPSLAAQPEFFLTNQLVLFREGVRKVEAMTPLLKELKDEQLVALAWHFTGQQASATDEPIDPALAKRGAELAEQLRCASCHLPSLAGQDQMPRLANQRVDYLIHALKEFRDDKRSGADTLMSNVASGLSDDDLAALAHYAASR